MAVMSEYKDVVLAFGESDEYRCVRDTLFWQCRVADCSFLIRQASSLYNRRRRYVPGIVNNASS
jgi:tRNA(His) 5'-end guanylyltransferase